MKWIEFGRKCTFFNFMYYPDICLECLRNTTNDLGLIGVFAEIRNGHLANTSQTHCSVRKLSVLLMI
jgi:hypothetical protein